ncbi:MAG: GNAT family N-acetyltransferase [Thermoguttaceae bacterium]
MSDISIHPQVRLIGDVQTFESLRESWHELVDHSVYPNIFTCWEWDFVWWKYYGGAEQGRELIILLIENDEKLLGILPLFRNKSGIVAKCLGPQLCWFGFDGITCPEYVGPVIRQGYLEPVIQVATDYIATELPNWTSFFFEDFALDDPGSVALADSLKKRFLHRSISGEPRFYVPLPNSYDEYLKQLSSHNRTKKKNRLKTSCSKYNATTTSISEENLQLGFDTLVNLVADSCKRKNIASPFDDKKFTSFHYEILSLLIPLNRAILFQLNYNDIPAAMWYTLLLHKKSFGYQQGCDSSIPGSPGDVILQNHLIDLIAKNYEEFDFLRGGEWYKTAYTDSVRETESLTIYRDQNIRWYYDLVVNRIYSPFKEMVKNFLRRTKKQ